MISWWKDISVAKKLYSVVGLMALLIATELFTLLFTMDVLSAVRSFVSGEGLWSKSQKDAVYNLERYSATFEGKYYQNYLEHLKVPLGDRKARLELLKTNPDLKVVYEGFLEGGIHPHDIYGVVRLIQRFYWVSYISETIQIWTQADKLLDELITAADRLHKIILVTPYKRDYVLLNTTLVQIERLNKEMTILENEFSYTLGEGSRWLESVLRWLVMMAVLTVETTGLFLTFMFSRSLSRSLNELSHTAQEVGKADFIEPNDKLEVPVRSKDELGQLAVALNKMIRDLEKNIGRRKKAESANKIKSLFLANMSHEIRTPLGVILGLTDILKDPNISESDRNKYLNIVERTGNNLKRIVNDILDISKVEAGHLEIEKSTFSFQEFIKDLHSMLALRAEKHDNKLVFKCRDECPLDLFTDRLRLRQILINLVDNALKFTKSGIVTMEYWSENEKLFFKVTDTGIGISNEDVGQLFRPFSQVDNSSTRKFEGTGLGLVLSKRLAVVLGGDVTLQSSAVDKGSVFLATIALEPLAYKESVKAGALNFFDASLLKGKRVLIVDDSPDNQLLVRVFLSRSGVEVECADNGKDGVQKALSGNFDLVLMDVQMPVMDGHTATRQLRSKGFTKPIIALTAHAMMEDRDRCLNAGCNDYLTKPIELAILCETVYRLICDNRDSKQAA